MSRKRDFSDQAQALIIVAIITLITTLVGGYFKFRYDIQTVKFKADLTQTAEVQTALTALVYQGAGTSFLASSTPSPIFVSPIAPTTMPTAEIPNVIALLPDAETIHDSVNIWSLAPYRKLSMPDIAEYSISVDSKQIYRWGLVWCAIDQNHLNNLIKYLSFEFLIDDVKVESTDILEYGGQSTGLKCNYWSTLLTNWRKGTATVLELDYSLSTLIFDGRSSYSPGDYKQIIHATIK